MRSRAFGRRGGSRDRGCSCSCGCGGRRADCCSCARCVRCSSLPLLPLLLPSAPLGFNLGGRAHSNLKAQPQAQTQSEAR